MCWPWSWGTRPSTRGVGRWPTRRLQSRTGPAIRGRSPRRSRAPAMPIGRRTRPRAFAALENLQAIAEQTRQPTQRWNAGFMAAAMTCVRGELDAAERVAEEALRIGQEAGQPDAAMIYGGTLVACRMFQGRGAEVVGLIEQMVTNNPGVPAWEAALGYTYCLIDRHAEGADVLARAATGRFELPRDQNQTCGWAM